MSRLLCGFAERHLRAKEWRNGWSNGWPVIVSVRHHLRGRRKEPVRRPIWAPIAPSKLFRIRQKPTLTPEEDQQRQHLDLFYATNLRSIEHYFREEFYAPTLSAGGLSDDQIRNEEVNQSEMLAENDAENRRVAELRAQRMQKLSQMMDQKIVIDFMEQTERHRQKGRQLDQIVAQEVKRSQTYITHEALEAAIEEALNHPITYDYSVDIDGNIRSDQTLHPYALRPRAVPEMSSNVEELAQMSSPVKTKFEPKSF